MEYVGLLFLISILGLQLSAIIRQRSQIESIRNDIKHMRKSAFRRR